MNSTGGWNNVAVLTGYAYETIPGKSICAGQTKGAADDGSEENSGPDASTSRNPHRWAHWRWERRDCRSGGARTRLLLQPSATDFTKPIAGVTRDYAQTPQAKANRRRKLVIWPPLKRAVTECKQGVGVEPLFMLRCDRSPVMLTWLQQLVLFLGFCQPITSSRDASHCGSWIKQASVSLKSEPCLNCSRAPQAISR